VVVIDQAKFAELLPILEELRSLIIEGDGSGRGRLPKSGLQAETVDAGTDGPG
jgi:hypothetical protein